MNPIQILIIEEEMLSIVLHYTYHSQFPVRVMHHHYEQNFQSIHKQFR
jgi:hypothetical protein